MTVQRENIILTKADSNMHEFGLEEYADAMQTMAANRGNGDEPKVGI